MPDYFKLSIMGDEAITVKEGTTFLELSCQYADRLENPILAVIANNDLRTLTRTVDEDANVEFIDITNINGFRIYQRSTVFLMVYAIKDVLGKDTRVVVKNSINKNFSCVIERNNFKITKDIAEKINNRMLELVEEDIEIQKCSFSVDDAIRICKEMNLYDKVENLKYRKTSHVNLYRLNWFYDYFYGHMAPSTGCLNNFKLTKQGSGVLLQFPSQDRPEVLAEKKSVKKLQQVFDETAAWGKILKADTLCSLNKIICDGEIEDFIRTNEALHEKKIATMADMIYDQRKNFVLIAGPSSSGKTTFAERLSTQLRVNGLTPHIISLDNYFVEREFTPKDEFGEYDFESINAIDIKLISQNFTDMQNGKTVQIPSYNFKTGKREYKGNFITMTPNDILVIEGIHGLNEKISACIPKNNKFKIFISALTQLNIDDHNRIATTDTRIIRRMVRDNRTRGIKPINTISMWPSVLRGEIKNIFPFQDEADFMFNSSLVYEMCVLKQYAEPLLFSIDKSTPQYIEARRLIKFLDSFLGVSSHEIPNNSILREFIGGSCFHV